VIKAVEDLLANEKLDAVICVAGGWAGGNAASGDLIKNSDMMWKQSVWSSVIAASLASKFLKEGGVLSLPGAKPALGPTPGNFNLKRLEINVIKVSLNFYFRHDWIWNGQSCGSPTHKITCW